MSYSMSTMSSLASLAEQREQKEEKRIARKRQAEEERRQRILDVKTRTLGVDVSALDEQVREKREREEQEKQREREYAAQMYVYERTGIALEKERLRARRAIVEEDERFRKMYQQKEQRREWDLSDPHALKREPPLREGDDDPKLGVSSCQILQGEDLQAAERIRAQQEQQRNWIEQQIAEKKRLRQLSEDEEKMIDLQQLEMTRRACEIDREIAQMRAEMERANKEFNLEQAQAKRDQERERKLQEQLDSIEDIHSQLISDWLNEPLEASFSAADPNRFRPDHFKQMRPDQIEEIRRTQETQCLHKKRREELEREDERLAALEAENIRRKALILERQQQRARAEMQKQLAQEWRDQMKEKQLKAKELEEAYANDVTEEFHNRFGVSSR